MMSRRHAARPFLLAAAILTCLFPAGAAAAEPDTIIPERARLIDRPGFVVVQLSNGLTVIVQEDHTTELVSLHFFTRAGSLYERPAGAGLTHLLEHLVMGGSTGKHTEAQVQRILQKMGNNSNAYTTRSLTSYYITTINQHAEQAFSLLTEFVTDAAVTEKEFNRELGVVQRELEQYANDPMRQLWYLTFECIYQDHPAAVPVIGYQSIARTITRAEVIDYYRKMYRPDNIVAVVVGDVNADDVLTWARRDFAHVHRTPISPIDVPQLPQQAGARRIVKRMATPSALVSLAWPTVPLSHDDLYPLDVLAYLLSEGTPSWPTASNVPPIPPPGAGASSRSSSAASPKTSNPSLTESTVILKR